jgi:hypothetical protein
VEYGASAKTKEEKLIVGPTGAINSKHIRIFYGKSFMHNKVVHNHSYLWNPCEWEDPTNVSGCARSVPILDPGKSKKGVQGLCDKRKKEKK